MDPLKESIFIARMAMQVGRYRDMAEAMKNVVRLGGGFNKEERNLFCTAYQSLTGELRTSLKSLYAIVKDIRKQRLFEKYTKQIESELLDTCMEVLQLINDKIVPFLTPQKDGGENGLLRDETAVAFVFYYKMMGDYLRYMAEICNGEEKQAASNKALFVYKAAVKKARSALPPTDPIRLGTALNLSVFYFEIQGRPEQAKSVIRKAFDDAGIRVQSLPSGYHSKTTKILHLLRNNLILWEGENV